MDGAGGLRVDWVTQPMRGAVALRVRFEPFYHSSTNATCKHGENTTAIQIPEVRARTEHAWIGLAARPCGGSVHGMQSINTQYSYEGDIQS